MPRCFDQDGYSDADFEYLAANVTYRKGVKVVPPSGAPKYGSWWHRSTGRTVVPPTAIKRVAGIARPLAGPRVLVLALGPGRREGRSGLDHAQRHAGRPAAPYRVTVNSFLADGGDGFTVLTEGTDPEPVDAPALTPTLHPRSSSGAAVGDAGLLACAPHAILAPWPR